MKGTARKLLLSALLFALMGAPSAARADKASELLTKAITFFSMGQFEASRRALEQVKAATSDKKILSRAELYLGLNHAVLGATDKARKSFETALGIDPTLRLDPNSIKGDLVKLFEEVRGKLEGRVKVRTARAARVYVDGKDRGSAPIELALTPGTYEIEVRSFDGLSSYKRRISVQPQQRSEVVAALERLSGRLTLRSSPTGAEVKIDGRAMGSTPLVGVVVKAGLRVLTVSAPGHRQLVRAVTIAPGKTRILRAKLKRIWRPAPKRSWFRQRLWTWVAASGALVAVGAGVALGVSSNVRYDDWRENCPGLSECEGVKQSIRSEERSANALLGIAAGLAAGAAILYFIEGGLSREERRASRPKVAPMVGASSYGGAVHVTF